MTYASTLCCTTKRARSFLSSPSPPSLSFPIRVPFCHEQRSVPAREKTDGTTSDFRVSTFAQFPHPLLPSFLPSFPCLFLFADKTTLDCDLLWRWRTEHAWMRKIVCTWLRDISCWTCFVFLPGPGWLHLNNICKPFSSTYSVHATRACIAIVPPPIV